jgi:hypothetical protein
MIFQFSVFFFIVICFNLNQSYQLFMKGGFGDSIKANKPPAKSFGSTGIKKEPGSKLNTPATSSNLALPIIKDPSIAKQKVFAHITSFNTSYHNLRALHGDPPIFEISGAFDDETCASYISRAEKLGRKVKHTNNMM